MKRLFQAGISSAVLALITLSLSGCGRSDPDKSAVESSVRAQIPAFWDVSVDSIQTVPINPEADQVDFKGSVTPKEDLYVEADARAEYKSHGLNPPEDSHSFTFHQDAASAPLKLLTLDAQKGHPYEVYGKCMAQHEIDRWIVTFAGFESQPQMQGQPRSAYDGKYLIVGSAEANAAFAAIQAHEKELADKRQNLLNQALPFVTAGTTYEGTAVYHGSQSTPGRESQRIRITFLDATPDGQTINGRLSNPDDNMDWTPIHGKIDTDAAVNTDTPDFDPTKQLELACPVQLENERDKSSRRDQMRSWFFYTQNGFRFWLGFKDGKLIGKGGFGLDRLGYDFSAEKVSSPTP